MGNKLGDLPTVELRRDELARYARDADKRAQASDSESTRATRPSLARSSEVEINVEVELDDEATSPELDAIPYVVASREDLSWFELEEASNEVLAKVDGTLSVEAIVLSLAIPSEKTLAIFRELRAHGVIEFR